MTVTGNNLRIVFICSSLDPGRDGIGDYTRLLAGAMVNKGHQCAIISLNDRGIQQTYSGHQQINGVYIPVTRVTSTSTDTDRYSIARAFIQNFQPCWLSLQFVPFGFDIRGLKFGLGKLLLSINTSAKWHVMVHELWVGMDRQSSLKHKLWGLLQKQLIIALLHKLKPAAITTQSALYQQQLAKMGYQSSYLPLYSNIPVGPETTNTHNAPEVKLVIFGNIHHGAPIQDFVDDIVQYGNQHQLQFNLTLLGHCGPAQQNWLDVFTSAGLTVNVLGQQPTEKISQELTNAHIGIATTPVSITDKSGSFAAMRAHGLSVISVSREWTPSGFENIVIPNGVFYYQKGNFKQFYANRNTVDALDTGVDIVAEKLTNLLLSF